MIKIKLITYLVMTWNAQSNPDYEDLLSPSPPAMPPSVPPEPPVWTTPSPEYTSDMCRTVDRQLPEFVDYKQHEYYPVNYEDPVSCRSCLAKCGNTAGECKFYLVFDW